MGSVSVDPGPVLRPATPVPLPSLSVRDLHVITVAVISGAGLSCQCAAGWPAPAPGRHLRQCPGAGRC
jgi:hypothetical protein